MLAWPAVANGTEHSLALLPAARKSDGNGPVTTLNVNAYIYEVHTTLSIICRFKDREGKKGIGENISRGTGRKKKENNKTVKKIQQKNEIKTAKVLEKEHNASNFDLSTPPPKP